MNERGPPSVIGLSGIGHFEICPSGGVISASLAMSVCWLVLLSPEREKRHPKNDRGVNKRRKNTSFWVESAINQVNGTPEVICAIARTILAQPNGEN